jgi:hypothetical protein
MKPRSSSPYIALSAALAGPLVGCASDEKDAFFHMTLGDRQVQVATPFDSNGVQTCQNGVVPMDAPRLVGQNAAGQKVYKNNCYLVSPQYPQAYAPPPRAYYAAPPAYFRP